MKEADYSTTNLQKKVYTLLINKENPRFPRTQANVCKLLGISKSTCCDATNRLVELGFITPYEGLKTNILYRMGTTHKIIDKQIECNYLESGEWFDVHGHAIRPPNHAEPYKPVWRMHLNGTWMKFTVAVKGDIKEIDVGEPIAQSLYANKKPTYPYTLFGDADPYELPGSKNLSGTIVFNKIWYGIRYQWTDNGNKFFYIQPGDRVIVAEEVTPDEDRFGPFLEQCKPLLRFLEKYGKWRFKHADTGEYEVAASVRSSKNKSKEYGMDPFLSSILHDYLGEIGMFGISDLWFDHSPDAQGLNGEMETNKADYVDAIDKLPQTTQTVIALIEANRRLTVEVQKIKVELMVQIRDTLNIIKDRNEIDNATFRGPDREAISTMTGTSEEGMYQ